MSTSASKCANTDSEIVWGHIILKDVCITDRGLRKWIAGGIFPKPDGNLNGRNFWKRETYKRWQADVLAGKYAKKIGFGRK